MDFGVLVVPLKGLVSLYLIRFCITGAIFTSSATTLQVSGLD